MFSQFYHIAKHCVYLLCYKLIRSINVYCALHMQLYMLKLIKFVVTVMRDFAITLTILLK